MVSFMKLAVGVLVALLPSRLKVPLYRLLCGYQIGAHVRIGFTLFIGVERCRIGDHSRIGHFNLFLRISDLDVGEYTQIGFLNIFRGGQRIIIGRYATILRLNVINSIPEADALNATKPILELGPGVVITSEHRLDFTDRITIGAYTIIGGRGSSLWTHNRQRTRPISI